MQDAKWAATARARLGLLGTIVLGVLIALALAAIATAALHHYDGIVARRAIGAEIGRIVGQADARATIAPCVERRLDALIPLIEQAAESGKLTGIGEFGMPPLASWPDTAWMATSADGTRAQFGRSSRATLADTYARIAAIAADNRRELDIWTELYTMVGPGRTIAPAEAATLRAAIGEARMLDHRIVALAAPIRQRAAQHLVPFEADAGAPGHAADQPAICQPVAAVPDHYGHSPI